MPVFRNITPTRKEITKEVSSYKAHRDNLQKDFNHRCGYCDCVDNYRKTYYEIDHFIPKKVLKIFYKDPIEYKTQEQKYSNLVYSCRSCNNAKGEKWPTGNVNQFSVGGKGFIDPCDPQYDAQFCRNDKGDIVPLTDIGKWMYIELELFNPEHSIIWKLEQIALTIKKIKSLPNMPKDMANKLTRLYRDYYNYDEKLRNY